MTPLPGSVLRRMALRASLLQATWNYERQQGLGWAWSLMPALARVLPDRRDRAARLAEHTAYFNTQPTLASVALGVVAGLEEQRAQGEAVDADQVARVKGVLGSALAALGDRLFWFTLRPFSACVGLLFAARGSWSGAVMMWIVYNLLHLGMRWRGVSWGYRSGPGVLGNGLRSALERLIDRIATLGAVLVGVLTALLLVPQGEPREITFQVLLMAGLVLGLLTAARARPTPSQWALGLGAMAVVSAWLR
jgi:PTS system mannose-specific IID component